ncbi:AbfB domain-containing protein [Streptomyces sp. TRM70350]
MAVLRSLNFPTRYLRHSNYAPRIGPISTATDRRLLQRRLTPYG